MASRIPLPLRLVQCELWSAAVAKTATTSAYGVTIRGVNGERSRSRILTPYKPSGLPCYAASQVKSVAASGGGGRHLCAIHTRSSPPSSTNAPTVEAGPQPQPNDSSDSLLSRVVDASLPGCAPYIALPVVSSLLRSSNHSGDADDAITAALLNRWTGRHKGLVLVTSNPSDALFLRNATQLGLVQRTYRVLCRLPPGVAHAARRYLRARRPPHQIASVGCGANGSSMAASITRNPYVLAHQERLHRHEHDLSNIAGIPLIPEVSTPMAVTGLEAVHPHPLVTGGFFDVARGRLRVQGTVRAYLRVRTPLSASSAAKVQQRSRLRRVFDPVVQSSEGNPPRDRRQMEQTTVHPWMRPAWRLGVSLDAPHMQCEVTAVRHDDDEDPRDDSRDHVRCRSIPAPRGKAVTFGFQLITLSPLDESDMALYEVHVRGDVTADEVAAVFQAEGLRVLNDYAQDISLATAIEAVAARMRIAPPEVTRDVPLGLLHRLRSATAEELVAVPLTGMPQEDADRLVAQHTLQQLMSLPPSLPFSEDVERYWAVVRAATAPSALGRAAGKGPRHPLHHLLLHALASLNTHNKEERDVYEQVVALTLGTGVECSGVEFPDPSRVGNIHALQQLWLTFEQQRQHRPSLEEAAQVVHRHPLASALQYSQRSVLCDTTGLTRVPLLRELASFESSPLGTVTGSTGASGLRRSDSDASEPRQASGECGFTEAVALLSRLSQGEAVPTSEARTARFEGDAPGIAPAFRNPASGSVWTHVEVPAPYDVAFREWCVASLVPSSYPFTAVRGVGGGLRGARSLWPLPQHLMQCCSAATVPSSPSSTVATTTAQLYDPPPIDEANHVGRVVSPAGPLTQALGTLPVRVFLRVEELAELRCANCGAVGHTWQHCVMRIVEAAAPLLEQPPDMTAAFPAIATAASGMGIDAADIPATPVSSDAAARDGTARPMAAPSTVMESEGIMSVGEAAAVLADQAGAKAHFQQRHQTPRRGEISTPHHALAPSSASISAASLFTAEAPLIAVPNVAATRQFNAAHVLRQESSKPAMHRRTMRCVYCGGRHHVTACPRLQEQHTEGDPSMHPAAGGARSDVGRNRLFCIKCGGEGHLYHSCPKMPVGLHPAVHCPICLQPRRGLSHAPQTCPQRVPVPEGYDPSGVARTEPCTASSSIYPGHHLVGENSRMGSTSSGRDHDVRVADDSARGTIARRPRRSRRGSVLIADSFVDAKGG